MCGRLDQNDINRLTQNFAWADELFNRSTAADQFNVAPGTFRPVLHIDEGELFMDDLHWGYRSAWAEASGKLPMTINTRIENITNRYWKPLLKRGRAIVPANGWYEWTGEKGSKQPWHIHRADGAPLYLAALSSFAPNADVKTLHAFTVVTASADTGLLDVRDRRPIVLTAEDAALWLDPALSPEQAEQLARSVALCPDAFAWHKVDKSLGNVRMQGAAVAQRIE